MQLAHRVWAVGRCQQGAERGNCVEPAQSREKSERGKRARRSNRMPEQKTQDPGNSAFHALDLRDEWPIDVDRAMLVI